MSAIEELVDDYLDRTLSLRHRDPEVWETVLDRVMRARMELRILRQRTIVTLNGAPVDLSAAPPAVAAPSGETP